MKIVIMAGGGGTRLWPLSRQNQPKQFSKIIGEQTMYEETLERFADSFSIENIYVCLNNNLLEQAKKLSPRILDANYIIEPERRDTGPAMAFVSAFLVNEFPDEPIAFIPSDHFIGDRKKFLNAINLADKLIRENGQMLDIAITPTFPSTVLGYTQIGKKSAHSENGIEVFEFLGHTEKPEFEIAKKYLENGSYLWHASYYMWTPAKILNAYKEYCPQDANNIEKMIEGFRKNEMQLSHAAFKELAKTSFDYAITEKMDPKQVLIIKGDFGWSDVGAFDVLYDAQKTKVDDCGNLISGNYLGRDSSNCFVSGRPDKLIATVGLNDFIVVDTDDVLLICPKSKSQEVKKLVEQAEREGKERYL
ncbi:MAG: sugar phosphate nucleotidyltransferase [Patescibacteria group bacterium]|mgnify:CR=1 FL=1